MHLKVLAIVVACLVSLSRARSVKHGSLAKKAEEEVGMRVLTKKVQPTIRPRPEDDILAMHKRNAFQVVMEKLLIALGPAFIKKNHGAPDFETHPTVSSPLNITTDPCPEIYTKCSSEIFLCSCEPPENANPDLWKQRLNLYFELPHDLLATDRLLNATLRLYKNKTLPVGAMSNFVVELYVYTKSLSIEFDKNILHGSKTVQNNYIGWISFDITDLIRELNLSAHHGFLIKVKESTGVYWNDPSFFIPMNCSDESKIVAVPFGIVTDQPEQKFPSLTIHTGMLERRYSGFESDDLDIVHETPSDKHERVQDEYYYPQAEGEIEEEEQNVSEDEIYTPHTSRQHRKRKEKRQRNGKKMSGDDPRVHDEIYSYDDSPIEVQQRLVAGNGEHLGPSELSHASGRKKKSNYHPKAYRKPVANQVYTGPMKVESELESPTPSALPLPESVPHPKEWNTGNLWFPTDHFENHPVPKKSEKTRKRHSNHQGKNGESHRSHSHGHSHHRHKGHDSRDHHNTRKFLDSNLKMES